MKSQTLKTRTIPIGLNITANSCVGMEVGHSPGIYVTSFEVGHFCGKYDSCMQYIYHASDFKSNRVNTLPTADSWYRKPSPDSALVCINIDISPKMAAQSAQRNQAFCVTSSDWSPITSA